MDLYEANKLNFSFEISYMPDAVSKEDGVLYIQADEHNMLTGLAIVSVPAYEEAVALSLVAEDESAQSDAAEQEGVETMNKDQMKDVEETIVAEEVAEAEETTKEVTAEATVAEEVVAEESSEEAVAEEAVAEEANPETAQAGFPQIESLDAPLVVPAPEPPAKDMDIDAAHAIVESEECKLRAQIARLEAELESLRADHIELEGIRAERRAQELAARQSNARFFAEKQGLDVESEEVANAIAEVNFEKLAELAMEKESKETVAVAEAYVASAPMNVETEKSPRERLFDTDM